MIDGAFLKGTLEMPVIASGGEALQSVWNMLPANRILCAVAVVLILITIADVLDVFPGMMGCIFRWHPCITLEHSLSQARLRNMASASFSLSLCLLSDRYGLYRTRLQDILDPQWSAFIVIGVFLAYILFREIIFRMMNFGYIPGDEKAAIHNTLYTFLLLGIIASLTSVGVMFIFKAPDTVVRIVLWSIIGLNWLLSLIRTGQIIADKRSGLSTFLYLCALEILPAGLVAASALLL